MAMRNSLKCAATVLCLIFPLVLGGCRRDTFEIEQHTPEATIDSAKRMVLEGRAELLTELIHAEDERMRRLLRGLGGVLGALEDLGYAVAEKFPVEVGQVKAAAERAAAEGKSSSMMARLTSGRSGQRPESRFSRSDDPMADAMMSLMADPFGWIKANADNLRVLPLSDGAVSLTWKGMPILPPFGVIMRQQDDNKWYIELPTGLPGIRNFVPKSDDELSLWLGVLGAIENSLTDLRKDIEKGRISSLDQASGKIAEYVIPTAAIGFFAYDRYRREQRAREREEARIANEARERERRERAPPRAPRPKPPAPEPKPEPPADGPDAEASPDAPPEVPPQGELPPPDGQG